MGQRQTSESSRCGQWGPTTAPTAHRQVPVLRKCVKLKRHCMSLASSKWPSVLVHPWEKAKAHPLPEARSNSTAVVGTAPRTGVPTSYTSPSWPEMQHLLQPVLGASHLPAQVLAFQQLTRRQQGAPVGPVVLSALLLPQAGPQSPAPPLRWEVICCWTSPVCGYV